MKINFTNKQYGNLLKLVYLGNWVANATRIDDQDKQLDALEGYIFSFAKDFGLSEYADTDDPEMTYPTRQFEERSGVQELIEEYDDDTFWEELPERLGERDLLEQHSTSELEQMDLNERIHKLYANIGKWMDEFETHGITRLRAVNMTMRTQAADDEATDTSPKK